MKVAVIGLGRMGRAIAGRLLVAGAEVTVHNRTPGAEGELLEAGARAAESVAAAAGSSEIVLTLLSDDTALEAVATGGLCSALQPGAIHAAMGTHGVAAVAALAERHAAAGQRFVAAPVLGRPQAAADGQLGIIVGGAPDAVRACAPLFELIGQRVFDAGGDPQSAAAVKLANGFVLACAIEALAESFSMIRRFAVDPELFREVLTGGLFPGPAHAIYSRLMVDESYDEPGFTTALGLKDVQLALAAADRCALPLPSVGVVRDRLLGAIAHGDADRDWAVLAREQARAAALE
jgi:3-hydroxyisobutyrate dehydrogenase-like beta-hydroxyacid dehydrogenase